MKCSYCGSDLPRDGGMMYVFRTGKINYYCSSRCYKYDIILHRKLKKEVKATAQVKREKPAEASTAAPKPKA
ncbi:MAG: 50S ribosomal protein L24e [Candidatus Marsarchaeota archaeon]|nr:50S ribosomal protein L24e [Candidatus Marsarchaeota archaeon]